MHGHDGGNGVDNIDLMCINMQSTICNAPFLATTLYTLLHKPLPLSTPTPMPKPQNTHVQG